MMIIPGLVSVTFREKSADAVLKLCRQAELKGVEWSENVHVFPGDPKGAQRLYEMTAEEGLSVAAYGSYYRLGEQDNPEEVFCKSLESAAALRAPLIRIWAGKKPSSEVGREGFMRLCREAALVAEIASAYHIKTAFEWHKDTLTDTNDSALELLNAADHPNLYCLWQPTAALSHKERLRGLDLLGERLLNLHMYYWVEGEKRPLKEGRAVWNQYLDHVDAAGCRYGLLEFVRNGSEEQFLEDARVLQEMIRGR